MKKITICALLASLTLAACAPCDPEPVAVVSPVADVAPTPAPAPTVICTTEITTNCEILFCPQISATACPPSPHPLPRHPVGLPPAPASCIRDDAPLVLVDGLLTDNCGNKYGNVTQ